MNRTETLVDAGARLFIREHWVASHPLSIILRPTGLIEIEASYDDCNWERHVFPPEAMRHALFVLLSLPA